MKFENIKDQKFDVLTTEQMYQLKGGITYTVNLTYNDIKDDNESDRSSDEDAIQ